MFAGAMLIALPASLAGATPSGAADPWLMVVYGDPLDAPVVIRGWRVNHAFRLSLGPPFQPDPEHLIQRPSLMLAHYAGPDWLWLESDDAVPLADDATYYGRFFPAVGRHPSIIQIYETGEVLGPVVRTTLTVRGTLIEVVTSRQARLVGTEGRAILERHGVATHVEPAAVDRLVLSVLSALLATLIVLARVVTRPPREGRPSRVKSRERARR